MFRLAALLLAFGLTATAQAAETRLTVPMDYALIRNVLIHQLYTGADETARFWKDGKDCSFLDADHPQIGAENGQIRIDNHIHARIGVQMAGKCLPVAEWSGMLRTFQKPVLDGRGAVLSFPVTEVNASDANGQLKIKQLQDLIHQAVQSKLADLKIDLQQNRAQIVKTLLPFIDANDTEKLQDTLNSLRFNQAQAGDKALQIEIGFVNPPEQSAAPAPQPVFNADELRQWQAVWGKLEQNMENGLNKPPLNKQSAADLDSLRQVLHDAGAAFTAGLTEDDTGARDPVRTYLNDSWDKLGPALRNASGQLPGLEGMRYLTLITATDIIYELETVTKPLGLEVSANGLRKLIRAYLAHQAVK
ncbi:MAG: hypothetical protein ABSB19_14755 [Methylomonas sp.]|jgi:hypothetical protein